MAWYVPLARAIPALVLAGVVTFSADHSAPFGFLVFGLFAVTSGVMIMVSALRAGSGTVRIVHLVQGVVTVIVGVVALAMTASGVPFLLFLVGAWAAVAGFLELYLGLRGRRRDRNARDWMFVGGLTALLAILVLLVPPGFVQPWAGQEGVSGQLTASIIVVGALGAYWAIIGVYLVIAALSLKWAVEPAPAGTEA